MLAELSPPTQSNVDIALGLLIFILIGVVFILLALGIGSLVRPQLPHPQKNAIYECGEPTIGTSWVQFNLRFYTVALFFIVFDVEIALLYPWAVVFRSLGWFAFVELLFFLVPVLIGYAYLLRYGYLRWVRETAGPRISAPLHPPPAPRPAT